MLTRDWTISDYVELTRGGKLYFLHPRSVRARIKWWVRRREIR